MKRRISKVVSGQAFSLIELLIVLGIIAVLAGMLVPVSSDMMSRARDTQCANNLRQIGVAANAAANDNDNTYPIIEIDVDGSIVTDALDVPALPLDQALANYGVTPAILQCPVDMRKGTASDYATRNPHSSYMWLPTAEDNNPTTPYIISRRRGQTTVPPSRLQLATDWNPEHIPNDISLSNSLGVPKMMYVLYADGHVRTGIRTKKH